MQPLHSQMLIWKLPWRNGPVFAHVHVQTQAQVTPNHSCSTAGCVRRGRRWPLQVYEVIFANPVFLMLMRFSQVTVTVISFHHLWQWYTFQKRKSLNTCLGIVFFSCCLLFVAINLWTTFFFNSSSLLVLILFRANGMLEVMLLYLVFCCGMYIYVCVYIHGIFLYIAW